MAMKDTGVLLRNYDPRTDLDTLRECVIELQDHEAALYSRLPSGNEVVENCLNHMFAQCEKCAGKILVAEKGGEICGFVTVLCQVRSEEPDDGDMEYGLVSDLVVKKTYRAGGIGRLLIGAAEEFARAENVAWLRIGVIAGNRPAEALYASLGFRPWYVESEKDLRETNDSNSQRG